MAWRLTHAAEEDLVWLYVHGARMFGEAQAAQYHRELGQVFELIAANPRMARERLEITPPVRIHPYKAHVVVYVIDAADNVLILRVRHGHEDWEDEPV